MHFRFILILVLILTLLYFNPKFNLLYSFENFYPFGGFQTHQSYLTNLGNYFWNPIPNNPALAKNMDGSILPNTYKYPFSYPIINPADSPYVSGYYIPESNGYTNFPWWNTSLGNTTNMSYDYRGDPLVIPRTNFVWNNGTNFPIYNEPV